MPGFALIWTWWLVEGTIFLLRMCWGSGAENKTLQIVGKNLLYLVLIEALRVMHVLCFGFRSREIKWHFIDLLLMGRFNLITTGFFCWSSAQPDHCPFPNSAFLPSFFFSWPWWRYIKASVHWHEVAKIKKSALCHYNTILLLVPLCGYLWIHHMCKRVTVACHLVTVFDNLS